jgi:hypothetical protein
MMIRAEYDLTQLSAAELVSLERLLAEALHELPTERTSALLLEKLQFYFLNPTKGLTRQ